MTILDFAGEHYIVTIILALIVAETVAWPFRIINRWIRHRNVATRGWPPAHLDADGDWKKED